MPFSTGWQIFVLAVLVVLFALREFVHFRRSRRLNRVVLSLAAEVESVKLAAQTEAQNLRGELSRAKAQAAENRLERELWAQYSQNVPRINQLAAFVNREFPAESRRGQEQRPPLHLFDLVRNILLASRGRAVAS